MLAFPFFNTVRHRAIITPVSLLRIRLIGASTQISGSSGIKIFGSGSNILKLLAPAPDQFGPKKNIIKHCIICTTRLPHKLFLWNRKPNLSSGSTN